MIIILTDGDLAGSLDVNEVRNEALTAGIGVVCVGVKGSNEAGLKMVFGEENAVYVEEIRLLPGALKRTVVGRS